MKFPPDLDPKVFTLIAFLVGYLIADDLSYNEQNSVGNWFMMVGQVLETISAQGYVLEEREEVAKQSFDANPPFPNNSSNFNANNANSNSFPYNCNINSNQELLLIKKTLEKMQQQIDYLLRNNRNF